MCGISAIATTTQPQLPLSELLQRMNACQAHRGPDGEGLETFAAAGAHVGLGHRRLSIVDLAGGKQPMSNEDQRVWVTYNGEIYNHAALRAELEQLGHRYRTRSDTETLVHAYEQWGLDCLARLRGMFAFVIWDDRRQRLFAARDRLGIKPFYYATRGGVFACASEAKALVGQGLWPARLNVPALPELMTFGYLAGTQTLFEHVHKLPPGHYLLWERGELRISQYWDLPPAEPELSGDEAELVEQFREQFQEAVRLRLMSDVPIGVFLSGGLDSSAIAATMAGQTDSPLQTFSVGFHDRRYSELGFAREVADHIGAQHHEVILEPTSLSAALPDLIWHEDAPLRNASSVALYHVAALASSHVKVVLTGEGSDELFAGYTRYWASTFNLKWGSAYERVVPRWVREHCVRRTLWKWPLPLTVRQKLSHTFLNHSLRPEEILFDNFLAIFPQRIHGQLFSPAISAATADTDPYRDSLHWYRRREGSSLDRLLYTDQKTYLVELLKKQDKMSMAASIESRVPFLDHQLVEFATRVPGSFKLRHGSEKYLVKQAMRGQLPSSIIDREKQGFPVPLKQWLRHDLQRLVPNVLLDSRSVQRELFEPTFVSQLIAEHRHGTRNHADALWLMLNVELWARIFLDGQSRGDLREELVESTTPSSKTAGVKRKPAAVAVPV